MSAKSILLAVNDIEFQYGNVCVWNHVSFDLNEGEIAFLVGANGSGKSTLLRCLAGWTPVKSGLILLEGNVFPSTDREQKAKVTFVPDVPAFYDDLTAEEHIDFVLKANRKWNLKPDAIRLLEAFGLYKYRAQFPSSYSRGMRVKLGIVLALCLKSKVLLLDEPFGPLDVQTSQVLERELMALSAEKTAILISHHQQTLNIVPNKILNLYEEKLEVSDSFKAATETSATVARQNSLDERA